MVVLAASRSIVVALPEGGAVLLTVWSEAAVSAGGWEGGGHHLRMLPGLRPRKAARRPQAKAGRPATSGHGWHAVYRLRPWISWGHGTAAAMHLLKPRTAGAMASAGPRHN